jgi:hypothetical protein
MLTLDTVRAAVLSDQPWNRLDELVRAEQAAGRKVKEIYDDLTGMADEIDRTPGISGDGSDAFGDTLDALTGYCREECAYKDPPNITLPSEEEVVALPRWARVAFAARCARRTLPLYAYFRPSAKRPHVRSVIQAVELAEQSAGRKTALTLAGDDYIRTGSMSYWDEDPADKGAHDTSQSAAYAAADAADNDRPARAFFALNYAAGAARSITSLIPFIRRDFDHLASLAEWQQWTDDTPVPPEVFGPLWPEGPPKGWPPITDVPQRADLAIEAFARDRATEQMIEDDIVNLFNALNRYHIARSGVRLTLEQFRSLLPALVPAEV